MKKVIGVVAICLVFSCGRVEEQKQSSVRQSPAPIGNEPETDSGFINNEPESDYGFREIKLNEKIGSKTLQEHLKDPAIPVLYKDIFLKKVTLYDDDKTLSLIDSLFSTDRERHPFYFTLVTTTLWWADGAFAEPLGISMKEYVENNPKQFVTYFMSEPVLTEADFKKWADGVAMEIGIQHEHYEVEETERVESRMLGNCQDCNAEEKKMVQQFVGKMKEFTP